jgi:hypothetical protein
MLAAFAGSKNLLLGLVPPPPRAYLLGTHSDIDVEDDEYQ